MEEDMEESAVDDQLTDELAIDEPTTEEETMLDEADDPEPEPAQELEPEPEVALSGTLVDGVREINVVASQFDFGPEVITVRQREEVRLLLTTDDVTHGIGLSEFGINARIAAGETTVVTFVADAAGEFTFFCSVPCGAGHGSMTGQLVVIG